MVRRAVVEIAVFGLGLSPLGLLVMEGLRGELGANPVEAVIHRTGDWSLWLLLATLAMTPMRRLTGQGLWLVPRRALGLAAFAWGVLHLAAWIVLDHAFDWEAIGNALVSHAHLQAGGIALLLLVPLAMTSTRAAMRWLGRRWKTLHRLVYVATALSLLHYLLLVKADWLAPGVHAAVFFLLMALRLDHRRVARRSSSRSR